MPIQNKSEDGSQAWLRLKALPARTLAQRELRQSWRLACSTIDFTIAHAGDAQQNQIILANALKELNLGLKNMLGLIPKIQQKLEWVPSKIDNTWDCTRDSFTLVQAGDTLEIKAETCRAFLYAIFHLLMTIAAGKSPTTLSVKEVPQNAMRMLDHWDNANGSIERGYAGKSIFFKRGKLAESQQALRRIAAYARMLASVGINAVAINNVNVHSVETRLITDEGLPAVSRIASIFRAWGIRLFLSVNYASPISLGILDTSDPLDPGVAKFWQERAKAIYAMIPDFGGFLVKADSEGRPGPHTYGRSHAEGANMLGRALEGYNGLVLWRCFVYNCQQNWRDRKTDRARAAYDHFLPQDGSFLNNVILQIKNGPMDFQVREPVSPLLCGLEKTKRLLEFQVTQEYTGQQKHLCCLLPQWKEVLDFEPEQNGQKLSSRVSGICAVSNVGDDTNWTGHHLAQSNLYGFARLTWNPNLDTSSILDTWTRLSFGFDPQVHSTIMKMLTESWSIYESYTAPLGVGWMVNPEHHYGPNVDGYEYSRWGTYHFAALDGIGVDRTVATGTGYAGQYHEPWRSIYENRTSCPREYILFFHHLAWDYKLSNGKTVIQDIYDTHFEGAEKAKKLLDDWKSLMNKLDPRRYQEVLVRLEHQASHAQEWRDLINTYCLRKSGLGDAKGRTIY